MKQDLNTALENYKKQYPSVTSADLQTFILGFQAANEITPTNTIQEQKELDDNKWKVGQWFNGSAIIQNEKQVLCRLFAHDFITDEEADMYAKALVKEINHYPKLIEVVKELQGAATLMLSDFDSFEDEQKAFNKLKSALQKSKEILP